MKKILLIALLFPSFLAAQISSGYYNELKYDNFGGPDGPDFQTEIQGFGSLNYNAGYSLFIGFGSGTVKPFLNINLGYVSKIFRFKFDNTFEWQDDKLAFVPDNPLHTYSPNFFSYSKSKLYNHYIRLHPEIGIAIAKAIMLSGGPVLDLRCFISQKNKYMVDEYRYVNELRRNNHFNSRLIHFGWRVNLGSPNVGVFATYMTTSFFKDESSPEINPFSAGIYFREFKEDIF